MNSQTVDDQTMDNGQAAGFILKALSDAGLNVEVIDADDGSCSFLVFESSSLHCEIVVNCDGSIDADFIDTRMAQEDCLEKVIDYIENLTQL